MLGAWSKSIAVYKLSTVVDVIRVPKARTSGEYLPIDTNFVSILLHISVLFSRTPYLPIIGGWYL